MVDFIVFSYGFIAIAVFILAMPKMLTKGYTGFWLTGAAIIIAALWPLFPLFFALLQINTKEKLLRDSDCILTGVIAKRNTKFRGLVITRLGTPRKLIVRPEGSTLKVYNERKDVVLIVKESLPGMGAIYLVGKGVDILEDMEEVTREEMETYMKRIHPTARDFFTHTEF